MAEFKVTDMIYLSLERGGSGRNRLWTRVDWRQSVCVSCTLIVVDLSAVGSPSDGFHLAPGRSLIAPAFFNSSRSVLYSYDFFDCMSSSVFFFLWTKYFSGREISGSGHCHVFQMIKRVGKQSSGLSVYWMSTIFISSVDVNNATNEFMRPRVWLYTKRSSNMLIWLVCHL